MLSEAKNEPITNWPGLDRRDVGADGFDDADVLVTHRGGRSVVVGAPVGPQVRAADAGRRQADDRVGGLDDRGVVALLEADVVGAVQHCTPHGGAPSFGSTVDR